MKIALERKIVIIKYIILFLIKLNIKEIHVAAGKTTILIVLKCYMSDS